MQRFSPTEAALEGFRTTKEHPRAVAIWAVLQLVLSTVMMVAMVSIAGPQLAQLMTAVQSAGAGSDPAAQMAAIEGLIPTLLPLYAILVPVGLLFQVVQSAAVVRAVLRPAESRAGFVRFGADEVRLLAVILAKALITAAITFVGTFVAGLFFILGAIGGLLGSLAFLACMAGLVYVLVRLSMAFPQTMAEGRIVIRESWKMTDGLFWPIFGTYLLAGVFVVVVWFIGALATGALTAIFAMVSGSSTTPDYSSLAGLLTPVQIVSFLLSACISALGIAIIGAPAAVIYTALSGRKTEDAF